MALGGGGYPLRQGNAIRRRNEGRRQHHIGRIFEAAARAQVGRMVLAGELPDTTIVGRWWRDEVSEIDVLALDDDVPVLVGERRWQRHPLSERDLGELRAKTVRVSDTPGTPVYGLWARGGATEAVLRHSDVRAYTCDDLFR